MVFTHSSLAVRDGLMSTQESHFRTAPGESAGLFHPGAPAEPLPEAIGKYRVLARLGGGAMGVVYQCSQPGLERLVAVKVMVAGRHATAEQILRFQREAQLAAQLVHPNVVQVHDVGVEGEMHFLVMEYVDGWSLDRLIGTRVLTMPRILRLVAQVARALQAAHARGIIHRDIKPSNILLARTGQPKLTDFGLAKPLAGNQNLSGSGDLIGTPRYMSPEQVLAAPQDMDASTDIYSLGAVLYEMLTGRPPVDGPNVLTILRKLTDEEPVPVRELRAGVPEEVAAICRKAMAKDKVDRYPFAAAFAEALEAYLGADIHDSALLEAAVREEELTPASLPPTRVVHRRRRAPWRRAILVGCLVTGLLALGVYAAVSPSHPRTRTEALLPPDAGVPPRADQHPAPPAAAKILPALGDNPDPAAKVVALAREMSDSPNLAGTGTPRERWKALLEKLTSVVLLYPDLTEARFLRARVHRHAGQYLAAIDDLNRVLRQDSHNHKTLAERLLSNYQLHVLYLANFNETLLRPQRLDRVRDDAEILLKEGNATQKYLAQAILALSQQDYAGAATQAEKQLASTAVRPDDLSDVSMVEADALLRAAVTAYEDEQNAPEGSDRDKKRDRREQLVRLANTALRRGLDANPNHAGLLFLKADTYQRAAVWAAGEGEDRGTMLKRQRVAFDTAVDRLRNVTSVGDCETAIALAVLLSNFAREPQAVERANDALKLPYSYTLRAWLRLQAPPPADGPLSTADIDRILREFEPAFDAPAEDWNTSFVRALLYAAAGRWDEARRDLKECRRKLGKEALPTRDGTYTEWLGRATNGPDTRYLDATLDVLWYLNVPEDLRQGLAEEVLRRLSDMNIVMQEGLKPDEVKGRKGWTHYRLAKSFAQKNDKANVLKNVQAALDLKLADLKPANFQGDGALSGWNEDKEFVALYKKYETP
jgi:tetratricopeptide (TPR) repeat protein/predicted Ser/Thr protein kinase